MRKRLGLALLAVLGLVSWLLTVPAGAAPILAPWTPRGITLSGLEDWLPAAAAFSRYVALPADRIGTIEAQISAAKRYWNVNTIRFQIVQDKLVGANGQVYSPVYMQQIRTVTDYARSLGLTVVLNAQTEVSTGFTRDERMPTAATRAFWWRIMHYYKNVPHVMFDLFNEPRFCTWSWWHRSMQWLVDFIRQQGAHNAVWVEGRWWGSTLAGVPLLRGRGIVYTFHHPGSPWPSQAPVNKTTWYRAFGYLTYRHIAVVDGEFVNFAAGYHWRYPRVMIPQYFQYLNAHHIGMTAWTLGTNVMNTIKGYQWATTEPTGDGWLVRQWFSTLP